MFTHIVVGANDLDASRTFYDAMLGAIGVPAGTLDTKGRLIYAHQGGRFLVTRPLDGQPATPANGGTIGFSAPSPEALETAHAAGVANGGASCEDPPGLRTLADGRRLHLAYVRDPAGNKLCLLAPATA